VKRWLVVVLALILVGGAWWSMHQAASGDRELPVYVQGAERMLKGEEIYRRGTDAKPFTYPPFFGLLFVPFCWAPEPVRAPWFFAVNYAVLLLVLRWLHRWAGRRADGTALPWPWGFWLGVGLLSGRYVFSVFENQSHDLWILGFCTLVAAAWCRGRAVAGVWSGIGAACKATPLLFLELFTLRFAIWSAVLLVLTVAVLTWLPDLVLPRSDGASWAVRWYEVNLKGLSVGGTADAEGAWNPHSVLNQSLSGTLTRLCSEPANAGAFVVTGVALCNLHDDALKVVRIAGSAFVLLTIAWGVLRARAVLKASPDPVAARRTLGLGEVALIACGMVLLSPQSSKAHFCVLLLPAAFCMRRLLASRDWLLILLLLAAFVLGPLSVKDLLGRDLGNVLLAYGSVTWCTVLLLLATVRGLRLERPQPSS
jgi:hypothetical protein